MNLKTVKNEKFSFDPSNCCNSYQCQSTDRKSKRYERQSLHIRSRRQARTRQSAPCGTAFYRLDTRPWCKKGRKRVERRIGINRQNAYDKYTALVEYEWAPINRLGLEVELPFSFYYPINGNTTAPGSKLNSLKLAAQYSFFVSEKRKTSLAIGYIQEFELTEFTKYGDDKLLAGNIYNPFFVAAKRWTNNLHTLLYSGPAIVHHSSDKSTHTTWQINSNFHYMITGTRNFIGVEFNKELNKRDFDMTIRPQMRVGIADNLLVGIVTGVPISRESERFGTFLRLIYEPGHKKHG